MHITHFETPAWRGVGKTVTATTAAEAIAGAGLDWEVEKQALTRPGDKPLLERVATVRKDTDAVLGVVSPDYSLVQNRDAFTFFDHVVQEGGASYTAAGLLHGGKRIWVQAQWDGSVDVVRGDTVEKFLLLHTSHDGYSALRLFLTPIRVACQNTLNSALRGAGRSGISIEHNGDMVVKLRQAEKTLGVVRKYYDDFVTYAKETARYAVSKARLTTLLDQVVPLPKAKEVAARPTAIREEITRLFESGRGIDRAGVRGTGWAFVNAVAEYVDYSRPAVGKTDSDKANSRLSSIWFGAGAALKARAWDAVLSHTK